MDTQLQVDADKFALKVTAKRLRPSEVIEVLEELYSREVLINVISRRNRIEKI